MKKVYSFIGVSILALSLAACDSVNSSVGMYADSPASSSSEEVVESSSSSASLNVVDASSDSDDASTSSTDGAVASETADDESVESDSSVEGDVSSSDSVASEAADAPELSAEEIESSIVAAQPVTEVAPSQAVPSSEVEGQVADDGQASAGAYDNTRAREILAEAAPLIATDSENAFQSDEYFFMPTLINEDLAQIDVYRQSPDGQGHANLITVYRYDAYSGILMSMDMATGNWENAGSLAE
ncbi:hypothetical protein EF384_06220 [Aerococcus agrisoli]|uniref:Uncharacterized protein n=1 Tax=Aerococcus agrisoli TaxID=2487350 RepID=A0A3N4GBJ3_9LACT|nr:hypothetical protein [Aerococcus agrisoli]RPA60149.1 hypothetical protein EF384_06220 [Aerococcus agrisoli]